MKKFFILAPIYNDWQSISKLLEEINLNVKDLNQEFSLIIVNDASTEEQLINSSNLENINSIKVLNMRENRGHARCIASGLKYINEKEEYDYIIPMDGDGEDRPEEIKNFIENINFNPDKAIVGERVKRTEKLIFKVCYKVHKAITYVSTGQSVKFGNYTCLPKSTIDKMINEKATWSSFSGALQKVEKDKTDVPSERGVRYFGPSKMSFLNLIKHSLSIISVFKINVLIRSILFLVVYLFLISENISNVTLIPFYFVILLNILTFYFSNRENLKELNNSLENISSVDQIK